MSDQTNPEVYVYFYLDPRKPGNFVYDNYTFAYEPFYVGKGSLKRSRSHLYQARGYYGINLYKERKIRKIWESNMDPVILLFKSGSQNVARADEKTAIALIGRFPQGPLTNIWPGGEAGPLGVKPSAATRAKMSKTRKGRAFSEQHKESLRKAWTEEKRLDASNNSALTKKWIVIDPEGHEEIITNLKRFCKERGLSTSYMQEIADGKAFKNGKAYTPRSNKGWKCRRP